MYEKLDLAIIDAVTASRQTPLYSRAVVAEADRIASESGRDGWRVIDARIQALRKAGEIVYLKKRDAPNNKTGWYLAGNNK